MVEKALQLAQVVASVLGMSDMAVAYNRVKPHMEATGRPVIQVGADSITSGGKFLALYERDINLLARRAPRGVILVDDVVTTGGTIQGLVDLPRPGGPPEEPAQTHSPSRRLLRGRRGKTYPAPPAPVHALARLPDPVLRPGTRKPGPHQGRLWPRP